MNKKAIFSWALMVLGTLHCATVSAEATDPEARLPNFEVGASAGLLSSDQLYGLDVTINMPVTSIITTQFLINSDYFVANTSKQGYSQSEVIGNAFLRGNAGRVGAGLGYKERKPGDEELSKESSTALSFYGDLYFGDLTVGLSETEYEEDIDTFSGQTISLAYYIDPNRQFFLRKEKINRNDIMVIGVNLQPEQFSNHANLNLSFETGDEHFYIGLGINYFFDTAISLKQRNRDYH
jgi:hypothetical protein